MKKALTMTDSPLYHQDGVRKDGPHTGLLGNCSGLRGDCTGLRGDCTGLWGNLDDCGLAAADRERGVNIRDLAAQRREGE